MNDSAYTIPFHPVPLRACGVGSNGMSFTVDQSESYVHKYYGAICIIQTPDTAAWVGPYSSARC